MFTTFNRSCRSNVFFNFTTQGTRAFSAKTPSTLVWVHGASSNIANAIKTKAITEKHFVKSAQRKPGYAETTKHQYVQLSSNPKKPQEDAIYDKNELLKLFEKNIPTGFAGEILFFNAVGGAHTEKWKNEKMKLIINH